uniref:tRNA-uridine aminocarboxypropyltransferase 1 n=1 Tax=Callorhinchus milii TaxID=7868 RepID=V9KXP5_CALMI
MSAGLKRTAPAEGAAGAEAGKRGNLQSPSVPSPEAQKEQTSDAFENLKLAPQTVLETLQRSGRSKCPKCHCSRMFYCYSCFLLVDGVSSDEIPQVKLPLKIDIIKHPNETDGKSTAVHAKLLARDDVNIYTYPCMPEYGDEKHEVVVMFPGPTSVCLEDLPKHLSNIADEKSVLAKLGKNAPSDSGSSVLEEPSVKQPKYDCEDKLGLSVEEPANEKTKPALLKRVIFIDSTWNQTNKIITDERLQELLHVELRTQKTCFWRHQKGKPDTYLSTIEAIYYFLVDYHTLLLKESYDGKYDNLLFFYSFMYRLIRKAKRASGKLS